MRLILHSIVFFYSAVTDNCEYFLHFCPPLLLVSRELYIRNNKILYSKSSNHYKTLYMKTMVTNCWNKKPFSQSIKTLHKREYSFVIIDTIKFKCLIISLLKNAGICLVRTYEVVLYLTSHITNVVAYRRLEK